MSILTIYEFQKLILKKDIIQYLIVSFLFLLFSLTKVEKEVINTILFISLLSNFIILFWLFNFINGKKFIKSIIIYSYPILGCFFIITIPYLDQSYEPTLICFVYAINWINNSFAYIIGKNFGKNNWRYI